MESNVVQLSVHEQLFAWFETHRRQVLIGAAVVTLAAIGTGFFLWRHNETETAANNALSKAGVPVGGQPTTATAYLNIAAAYPGTGAGARALLIGAGMLFAEGNYPESRSQFEKYLREYRETPLAVQALLGVAVCQDVQGNTNEAVAAYRDIIEHHPSDNVVPQAKFALARLYESQNKMEQARDIYQALARPGPYESISTEAVIRLKELILKHPELAAARPTPAAGMPALKFSNP